MGGHEVETMVGTGMRIHGIMQIFVTGPCDPECFIAQLKIFEPHRNIEFERCFLFDMHDMMRSRLLRRMGGLASHKLLREIS